jgi:hypothetical protein
MSKPTVNGGFFEWIVSLIKKPKPVVVLPPAPTAEELAAEAKWILIKSKYALEHLPTHGIYLVKYRYRDQWWYLRRWAEDYTLERVKGMSLKIQDTPNYDHDLDLIIKLHQEWINEGHIHLNYD